MARSHRRDKNATSPRPAPDHGQGAAASWREWLMRVPRGAAAITLLLLVTALLAVPPIRDAVSGGPTSEAHFRLPVGYIGMAPVSAVLDTLTLMTVPQHIAFGVWVLGLYLVWRVRAVWIARAANRSRVWSRAVARELAGAVALIGGLFVLYAAMAFLPRPMAGIASAREDAVVVDFHMHTKYSHDGRSGWTPDDVRAWVRGAGFDAAYISDHRTFQGADEARAGNPAASGSGTMLLPAIEVFFNGEHVNVLNAGPVYRNLTTDDLSEIDAVSLGIMSTVRGFEPVLVETIPGNLDQMIAAQGDGSGGVRAIELIDGAPRGLTQSRHERQRIIRTADSLDLALVTGSDNHGYGRAAAGWTLLRAPEWQTLSGDSLAKVIEMVIRGAGAGATHVVERTVGDGTNPLSVAFTPIVVGWRMLTTLSWEERVAWLVWTWGIAMGHRLWSRRRRIVSTA